MNGFIQNMINRIEAGEPVNMGNYVKNRVNAVMAERLKVGDEVEIISPGKITQGMNGIVIGKVVYNRISSTCINHNGYTAIQVKTVNGIHNYAARNLRPKHRKETENGK